MPDEKLDLTSHFAEAAALMSGARALYGSDAFPAAYTDSVNAVRALCERLQTHAAPTDAVADAARHSWAATVAENPVFIGGLPRAGKTTLARIMLAHPELATMQTEFRVEPVFMYPQDGYRRARMEVLGKQMLEVLISSGRLGYPWVLTGGDAQLIEPYIQFLPTFHHRLAQLPADDASSAIRSAAYAFLLTQRIIDDPARVRYWIHHSWTNTFILPTLYEAFPNGRFICCLRDPRASLHELHERLRVVGITHDVVQSLRDSQRALVETRAAAQHFDPARFMVLHLEDLVTNTEETLARVQDFLGLNTPLVADHLPERPSRAAFLTDWRHELAPHWDRLLRAYTWRQAKELGYELPRPFALAALWSIVQLARERRRTPLTQVRVSWLLRDMLRRVSPAPVYPRR